MPHALGPALDNGSLDGHQGGSDSIAQVDVLCQLDPPHPDVVL
jgi:hypothetical protein